MHPCRLGCTFPVQRVISLSSRTRITSYGLAEAANTCVTHMSATIGRPGSGASRSPRSGLRRERGGSCCAAAWPREARGGAGAEEMGGPGTGGHGRLSRGCGLPVCNAQQYHTLWSPPVATR